MSDVRNYLLTVDNDGQAAEEIARGTANRLELRSLTLIDIVQSIGEYINDEDATVRSKAVKYLSQVIGMLSPAFLTRQEVQVLCQFLCDRIEDGGAIGGLRKLLGLARFNRDMAAMTFRAMLEHFQDLQIHPQSQRLKIFELLNDLMSQYRSALKDMGNESLVGIIDLVSGEKDPRNLMISFSVLKVVIIEWDIVSHAETLFDSVFCYFPITFRPVPGDPYGITAQDLKVRLRDCISASGCFAPFAFPQLIDKLDSTSPSKDVLQTIGACASSYMVTTISNYSTTLWDSLKYEILNVQEEDVAEEALSALQAIAIKLSRGLTSTDPKTSLARYLATITKECNDQLQEPQHKQAKPVGQILSSLGKASPVAFFLIVKAVVPPLITLYQDADSISKQRALLETLVQIFDSATAVYGNTNTEVSFPDANNPLEPFKDRLFELASHALMSTVKEEVSFRVVALKGLLRLCLICKFMQDNEVGMVVQYLDEIVLAEDFSGRDVLKNEAIQALVEISKTKPNLIMDITFPAFMARLPDFSTSEEQDYIITLEGLARLSVEKAISDTLVRRLLNKLDVVLRTEGSSVYPQAILSTLCYVLGQRDLVHDPNLGSYFENITVAFVNRAVMASAGHGPRTALNEEPTLEILGRLANLIVHALDTHKQTSVAAQLYSLFADKELFVPVPFRDNTPDMERSTMILSCHLMAGLSREASLPYIDADSSDMSPLLKELVRLALSENAFTTRQSILRQVALLVNKFLDAKDVHHATNILWSPSTGLFEAGNISDNSIRCIFWIGKALILRLASVDEVLGRLLDLLHDATYGLAAARGFALLLAPDEILSKTNGATIRLLAKQRVFSICVPSIARNFGQANKGVKPNYLIALSGILKNIPTEVVLPELDTLLPLLLQSLDLQDPDVKAATIETLTVVAQESPKAVEEHVSSLVGRLMKAAGNPEVDVPRVRLNALCCLRVFPGRVKESVLLPYKNAVTWGLKAVLDDPKRYVRKEAVATRAAWELDDPEGQD